MVSIVLHGKEWTLNWKVKLTFCRPHPIRHLVVSRVGVVCPTRVRVVGRPRLPVVPMADPMARCLRILVVLKRLLQNYFRHWCFTRRERRSVWSARLKLVSNLISLVIPPDAMWSPRGLVWRHPWLVSPLVPTPLLLPGLWLGPIVTRLIRVNRGLVRTPAIPSIRSIISHFNCFSSKFEQKATKLPCGAGGLCSACFGMECPSWDHHSVPFDWEWIRLLASGTVSGNN